MGTAKTDAGMTILELVVALGIVAGLLAMLSASIRPPSRQADGSPDRLATLLQARTKAILTGTPQIVADRGVIPEGSEIAQRVVAGGLDPDAGAKPADGKIVFYPDGTSWPIDALSSRSARQ